MRGPVRRCPELAVRDIHPTHPEGLLPLGPDIKWKEREACPTCSAAVTEAALGPKTNAWPAATAEGQRGPVWV